MNTGANAIIDAIGIVMALVVFASSVRNKQQGSDIIFKVSILCVTVVLLLDIPAWILDGASFRGARVVCMILNTAYYIAQIVYCRIWLLYVDDWITGGKTRNVLTRILLSVPMMIEIILIFANIKTGWIFTIGFDNVYARGVYYVINLLPYFFYILSAIIYASYGVFKSRKTAKHRQNLSILIYMFLPLCGAIIQSFAYGMSLLWPFIAISLLMVYLNLQSQKMSEQRIQAATQAAKTAYLSGELADSRVKIMLSQIQPHFLYNTLSVIQALCETDPNIAAKATENFTVYLRSNMNSLNSDKPVPFEKELLHTKRYLSLEKLRFEDNLTIEYDILTTDFSLPSLTLQPIVENAVRYGITKRDNGGKLTIATRETKNAYEITVSDNGVGFDAVTMDNNDRTHIGIANVKWRLCAMCGGTLIINSTAGVGTEAIITVPKPEKK